MKLLIERAKVICLLVLAVFFWQCEDDDEGNALPEIIASFTQIVDEDTGTVSFINISENADSYEWDFGDGTTSTQIDPIKTYETGNYTVSLTAFNVAGASSTFEDELVIVIPEPITMPITFDAANVNYDAGIGTFGGAAFEIVANPAPGGSNDQASQVGAVTNNGAEFEGFFFDLGTALDLTEQKTVAMNFWSEDPIDVLLKLEQGTGADTEVVASHGGTGWEMISFDFTSSDSFSRLTLFVDGPGTTAGTFYIDDITQGETTAPACTEETEQSLDATDFNLTFQTDPTANIVDADAVLTTIANPDADNAVNPSCQVGQIDRNGGALFANNQIEFSSKFDFNANSGFKLKVWAPTAGTNVLVKLEDKADANINVEVSAVTTQASAWEELTFDFDSSESDKYDKIILFFELNTNTTATYYIDDFMLYSDGGSSGGSVPTTSAPVPPARDAADVISIYGGTYTNITGINYNPDWGQSGLAFVNTDFDPGDGNLALAYPTFNYQGTDFSGNAQDASAMEFLHVDIWVPSGTDRQVKISPINSGTGAGEVLVEVPLTPGSWNSVDLPIGDFTGMTWDSVIQMKFDGQFNGDGSANTDPHDIYLDNIYFYKEPSSGGSAPTTSAPVPPARDAADVISIYGGTYTNITGINYNPDWGQSGLAFVNTDYDPGDGNLALAYPTFNYQGTDFSGNAQDASAMEFLHVDIWVPSGTDRQVKISPINSGTGAGEVLVEVPLTPGSWNSVDLPIGDFTGMTWDSVIQMKFDGQFNGDGSANTDPHDIYLDNIYFYRTAGGGGGCPAPPTGELLSNGGFEANSGDGACWQLNDGGGTVTVIDTDANTGTYSARLTSGPAQVPNIKQERFAGTIAGNQNVQVTFRYKITTAFVDGAILQVLAFSEFTTDPAVAHDLGNATDVSTVDVWQTYAGTFTTDANIEEGISLLIQATCGGAGTCAGEVLIDDVVVTEI